MAVQAMVNAPTMTAAAVKVLRDDATPDEAPNEVAEPCRNLHETHMQIDTPGTSASRHLPFSFSSR